MLTSVRVLCRFRTTARCWLTRDQAATPRLLIHNASRLRLRVIRALKAAQLGQSVDGLVIKSVTGTTDAHGHKRKTVYRDYGYVVVNHIGEPYSPAAHSALVGNVAPERSAPCEVARDQIDMCDVGGGRGCPSVTKVAAWLGQRDSSVTLRRYAVAHPEHLTTAAAVVDC